MNINKNSNLCLTTKHDDPWLWHKRFCHINFKYMNKSAKYELVRGLPKINYKIENICDDCQIGKLKKSSLKSKNNISTKQPL